MCCPNLGSPVSQLRPSILDSRSDFDWVVDWVHGPACSRSVSMPRVARRSAPPHAPNLACQFLKEKQSRLPDWRCRHPHPHTSPAPPPAPPHVVGAPYDPGPHLPRGAPAPLAALPHGERGGDLGEVVRLSIVVEGGDLVKPSAVQVSGGDCCVWRCAAATSAPWAWPLHPGGPLAW